MEHFVVWLCGVAFGAVILGTYALLERDRANRLERMVDRLAGKIVDLEDLIHSHRKG